MMNTASVVKERVADLVSHLESSRRALGRVERERDELVRRLRAAEARIEELSSELGEAVSALADVRDQLQLTLDQIGE
jgi:chromosome segregation ATPase